MSANWENYITDAEGNPIPVQQFDESYEEPLTKHGSAQERDPLEETVSDCEMPVVQKKQTNKDKGESSSGQSSKERPEKVFVRVEDITRSKPPTLAKPTVDFAARFRQSLSKMSPVAASSPRKSVHFAENPGKDASDKGTPEKKKSTALIAKAVSPRMNVQDFLDNDDDDFDFRPSQARVPKSRDVEKLKSDHAKEIADLKDELKELKDDKVEMHSKLESAVAGFLAQQGRGDTAYEALEKKKVEMKEMEGLLNQQRAYIRELKNLGQENPIEGNDLESSEDEESNAETTKEKPDGVSIETQKSLVQMMADLREQDDLNNPETGYPPQSIFGFQENGVYVPYCLRPSMELAVGCTKTFLIRKTPDSEQQSMVFMRLAPKVAVDYVQFEKIGELLRPGLEKWLKKYNFDHKKVLSHLADCRCRYNQFTEEVKKPALHALDVFFPVLVQHHVVKGNAHKDATKPGQFIKDMLRLMEESLSAVTYGVLEDLYKEKEIDVEEKKVKEQLSLMATSVTELLGQNVRLRTTKMRYTHLGQLLCEKAEPEGIKINKNAAKYFVAPGRKLLKGEDVLTIVPIRGISCYTDFPHDDLANDPIREVIVTWKQTEVGQRKKPDMTKVKVENSGPKMIAGKSGEQKQKLNRSSSGRELKRRVELVELESEDDDSGDKDYDGHEAPQEDEDMFFQKPTKNLSGKKKMRK